MSQEQTIDVLIIFDTETIIEKYGKNTDSNNPTQITQQDLIYMVTKQGNAVSGEAGNELKVAAKTMDEIRWHETTLSLNADAEAILYKFIATQGQDLISTPEAFLATVKTPLPNPADPQKPTMQEVQTYFWNSIILKPGQVTYHFQFMIVDRDGTVQGYYWWDPYIQITD